MSFCDVSTKTKCFEIESLLFGIINITYSENLSNIFLNYFSICLHRLYKVCILKRIKIRLLMFRGVNNK